MDRAKVAFDPEALKGYRLLPATRADLLRAQRRPTTPLPLGSSLPT